MKKSVKPAAPAKSSKKTPAKAAGSTPAHTAADTFTSTATTGNLTTKLWRGERMCLIGMDVDNPEPDFVGFSIEVKSPGQAAFMPLRNRLAFSYSKPATAAVTGSRDFPSLVAPFQKFRWVHFPYNPQGGAYTYRVTKQHMHNDGSLTAGNSTTSTVSLDPTAYSNFLDIGFTRGYASSQAYDDLFNADPNVIPKTGASGIAFDKSKSPAGVYQWLGFEAYDLIFNTLKEVVSDATLLMDAFTYDFDEPDILDALLKIGPRLRIIMDDSGKHKSATSDPSVAAAKLQAAGAKVVRMHFKTLQHNKVLIVKKKGAAPGVASKVLHGSTNFSFRGIYIQANNALLFSSPDVASLFEQYFDLAFTQPETFTGSDLAKSWHSINVAGAPPVQLCLSPHADPSLSLGPVANAIDNATSSVFFAIAFLYQSGGLVRDAVDLLMKRPLFSYGISDKATSLIINKPDGSVGMVPFAALNKSVLPPFNVEWSGGSGIQEHNKFVVVDFNLPTARVYTGSCNLSPNGETGNGDNLICIQDPRVATSYAIQALLIFDHLHFASTLHTAKALPTKAAAEKALTLQKPVAISGLPKSWFASYYVAGSQAEHDRLLFSH
jgi:hypothetical protein